MCKFAAMNVLIKREKSELARSSEREPNKQREQNQACLSFAES